jgi:uncharacterized membrane protein
MPPLHPAIVHFPIALMFAAGALYLVGFLRGSDILLKAAFAMHIAGLVFGVLAILTGDYAENQLVQNKEIHALAELHEMLAMVAIWAFALLAVWAYVRHSSKLKSEKIAFMCLLLGVIGTTGFAAHLGGSMVYLHGAGVVPMREHIRQDVNSIPSDSFPEPQP